MTYQRFCFFLVFLLIFVYEITLSAIDVDNFGCLEPFLPLYDHFKIRTFMGLRCKVDLALRHIIHDSRGPRLADA